MSRREDRIAEAIRRHLDEGGSLPCAAAFRVAKEVEVEPLAVGQAADILGVRLNRCQLGLFGYGPKTKGLHKVVKPAEEVEPGLAQAVRDALDDEGELSCRTAWDIAAALGMPRVEVAVAAETLAVKIVRCQLGMF